MKKNYKILVIGGDSYIAKNFVRYFKDNYNFLLISRRKTYYKNEYIIENFFSIDDILFKNIDVVINFAAIVHKTFVSKKTYEKVNYLLPKYLFELSKENGVKHFIQMSTVNVYQRKKYIYVNSLEKPKNNYGNFKLKTDNYLKNNHNNKILVTILRPPLVYGKKAPGNLHKLLLLSRLKIPLPFRDLNNKLYFIHVYNLSSFINIVIINKLAGTFIPADKNPISTLEIITKAREILGIKNYLFKFPNFISYFIRVLTPNLYDKVFGSLILESNINNSYFYQEKNLIDELNYILSK